MTNLYTDDNSNDNDGTYDAHDGDGDSVWWCKLRYRWRFIDNSHDDKDDANDDYGWSG